VVTSAAPATGVTVTVSARPLESYAYTKVVPFASTLFLRAPSGQYSG
jgi:hypothetical protein